MKCEPTMKSAPFLSKKRSGLVFLYLKITVSPHLTLCVGCFVCVSVCVSGHVCSGSVFRSCMRRVTHFHKR